MDLWVLGILWIGAYLFTRRNRQCRCKQCEHPEQPEPQEQAAHPDLTKLRNDLYALDMKISMIDRVVAGMLRDREQELRDATTSPPPARTPTRPTRETKYLRKLDLQ
jgi:hypothetical protein